MSAAMLPVAVDYGRVQLVAATQPMWTLLINDAEGKSLVQSNSNRLTGDIHGLD